MFSLESLHRGDSNEYKQHAIINIKKKITINYPKYNNVCSYGIFPQGLKNKFEIAVVNEPSVFEPLKFDCSLISLLVNGSVSYIFVLDVPARVGSVVRSWCWVKFQCRGVLLFWIIVGQQPIALALGAGLGRWVMFGHFFSCLSFLFSFSLSGRRSEKDKGS